jgi:chitosanase
MLDAKIVKRIKNVLCVAEQGVQKIPYGKVEVMADGPNGVRQITLSIGFTQFGGNLGKVVEAYGKSGGKWAHELMTYAGRMKDKGLVDNREFKSLLAKAGKEDSIMGEIQERLFEELYMGPAIKWGDVNGFVEPYSYLVICDSFLHSGSILSTIRSRFSELVPASGGREKVWTSDYVKERHKWLKGHSNSLVRTSAYRTDYYLELLELGDWELDKVHTIAMNGVFPEEVV